MNSHVLDKFQGFEVACGPVTLKVPSVDDTFALANIVYSGLFPDGGSTLGDWYDPADPMSNARKVVSYQFLSWDLKPDMFPKLPFAIMVDNHPVGVQSVHECAAPFKIAGELGTGSWIDPGLRGRGYGRFARFAALHVGFELLGAATMVTSALVDNVASNKVSEACGYVPEGLEVRVQQGERIVLQLYRMDKTTWDTNTSRPVVQVVNPGFLLPYARSMS